MNGENRNAAIAWFVARIKRQGAECEPTIEGIRRKILDNFGEHVICGTGPGGQASTYSQTFERAFKQPLIARK